MDASFYIEVILICFLCKAVVSESVQMCLTSDHRIGYCSPVQTCRQELSSDPKFRQVVCYEKESVTYICCPKTLQKYLPNLTFPGCGLRNSSDIVRRPPKKLQPLYMMNGEDPGVGAIRWIGIVYIDEGRGKQFRGGCSVISPYFLLTAAHLFDAFNVSVVRVTVKLAAHREIDRGREYNVIHVLLHHRYNPKRPDYDLALLRVSQPIVFDQLVGPACLALPQMSFQSYLTGQVVSVQGYGQIYFGGPFSVTLLEANLRVITNEACMTAFTNAINVTDTPLADGIKPYMICASTIPGKNITDSCTGDSGGPMTFKDEQSGLWFLVGIVSFGVGCGTSADIPGIYTRVSFFLEWIRQHTDLNAREPNYGFI